LVARFVVQPAHFLRKDDDLEPRLRRRENLVLAGRVHQQQELFGKRREFRQGGQLRLHAEEAAERRFLERRKPGQFRLGDKIPFTAAFETSSGGALPVSNVQQMTPRSHSSLEASWHE